jgi:hypothetical protein
MMRIVNFMVSMGWNRVIEIKLEPLREADVGI